MNPVAMDCMWTILQITQYFLEPSRMHGDEHLEI